MEVKKLKPFAQQFCIFNSVEGLKPELLKELIFLLDKLAETFLKPINSFPFFEPFCAYQGKSLFRSYSVACREQMHEAFTETRSKYMKCTCCNSKGICSVHDFKKKSFSFFHQTKRRREFSFNERRFISVFAVGRNVKVLFHALFFIKYILS